MSHDSTFKLIYSVINPWEKIMHTDLEKKNIRKTALNYFLGKIQVRNTNSTLFGPVNSTQ